MDTTAAANSVRTGFEVRTADNQPIGKVRELLKGSGDEGSYLRVQQGWLFSKRDTYIRFDQVARTEGNVAYLRLSKEQLGQHVLTARPSAFRQIPEREP